MSEKLHFVLGSTRPRNVTMSRRHGNKYVHCKLSDEHVAEIRRRYGAGGVTQQQLAVEFNVHRTTISNVVRRQHYDFSTE
jgi:hypothetical protein